mgnify:CR=1 FL=1
MKRAIYLAAFAILFLAASDQLFAQAQQDFTLVNQTGVDLYQLHVSPSDTRVWGDDVLASGTLKSGEQTGIVFGPTNEVCLYDIKVTDKDGNSLLWLGIDLCKYYEITLYYDFDKAEGTATFK